MLLCSCVACLMLSFYTKNIPDALSEHPRFTRGASQMLSRSIHTLRLTTPCSLSLGIPDALSEHPRSSLGESPMLSQCIPGDLGALRMLSRCIPDMLCRCTDDRHCENRLSQKQFTINDMNGFWLDFLCCCLYGVTHMLLKPTYHQQFRIL